jgi:hypothetical protein
VLYARTCVGEGIHGKGIEHQQQVKTDSNLKDMLGGAATL